MRGISRLLAGVTWSALIIGATTLGAPTAAAAAAEPAHCFGWSAVNFDAKHGNTIRGANMKAGFYADCNNVVWMPAGTHVYYWCYVSNDFGNTWTFARIAGTNTSGWISDDHLPLNDDNVTRGATERC